MVKGMTGLGLRSISSMEGNEGVEIGSDRIEGRSRDDRTGMSARLNGVSSNFFSESGDMFMMS